MVFIIDRLRENKRLQQIDRQHQKYEREQQDLKREQERLAPLYDHLEFISIIQKPDSTWGLYGKISVQSLKIREKPDEHQRVSEIDRQKIHREVENDIAMEDRSGKFIRWHPPTITPAFERAVGFSVVTFKMASPIRGSHVASDVKAYNARIPNELVNRVFRGKIGDFEVPGALRFGSIDLNSITLSSDRSRKGRDLSDELRNRVREQPYQKTLYWDQYAYKAPSKHEHEIILDRVEHLYIDFKLESCFGRIFAVNLDWTIVGIIESMERTPYQHKGGIIAITNRRMRFHKSAISHYDPLTFREGMTVSCKVLVGQNDLVLIEKVEPDGQYPASAQASSTGCTRSRSVDNRGSVKVDNRRSRSVDDGKRPLDQRQTWPR